MAPSFLNFQKIPRERFSDQIRNIYTSYNEREGKYYVKNKP